MTKTVDIHDTQTPLKDLVSLVVHGTEVILVEGGTPVARLIPVAQRIAGLHSGSICTSDDFDEPLPHRCFRRIKGGGPLRQSPVAQTRLWV